MLIQKNSSGYDGLHPNALGEYQIAHAFSRTLANDFNLGSGPLKIPAESDPDLVRNLPVPSNFRVFSSPQGVTATWDAGKEDPPLGTNPASQHPWPRLCL